MSAGKRISASVKPNRLRMELRPLCFQVGYDLLRPFDRTLVTDRALDLAKSLDGGVDRRALLAHGFAPSLRREHNTLGRR
jgi:hypothetical protein